MEYYGIGRFSKLIGVTAQSLRNWDKTGKLKPHHVAESGYRDCDRELPHQKADEKVPNRSRWSNH